MTHHQHDLFRTVVQRLRPSATSFAAAGALYDPELLLALGAAQQERTLGSGDQDAPLAHPRLFQLEAPSQPQAAPVSLLHRSHTGAWPPGLTSPRIWPRLCPKIRSGRV
jgi:hypothetical protein